MNSLKVCLILVTILFMNNVESELYTTLNNKTYYILTHYNYNWFDAHLECSARDMALLTIDSKEKYYDIYKLLLSERFSDKPPHLWVGAIGIKQKFAWILTGKPIIPSLWCNICPNNSPDGENCVQFWGNQHGLNDLNCNAKNGFICEDRIQIKECKENKSNVVLNIVQSN